jgi:hypothetical protein
MELGAAVGAFGRVVGFGLGGEETEDEEGTALGIVAG